MSDLRKNAQIGKFSFFVKIPKSDFLALIRRFWYLMTLLDQGYQKTKKIGFLELKKNSRIFYSTVKSRFSPILELRKNAQIGKFSFFVKIRVPPLTHTSCKNSAYIIAHTAEIGIVHIPF